jgi:hypothetical protein
MRFVKNEKFFRRGLPFGGSFARMRARFATIPGKSG